ncbi:MAG TPA: DUF2147 domain-containing protein [Gammaproteobacteria bacterium]|nr:DUF2147 domain-containing protein [Gammaproteobacteria bacterium]
MAYPSKLLKKIILFFSMSYLFCGLSLVFASDLQSPLGYWKTIDDVTNQPKSIVQIYTTRDQTINGRVIKLFPKPGEDPNRVCVACKGEKHNQKIAGMVVMEGMKADGNKWDGGRILDPKNGKTYRCTLRLIHGGHDLEVRGYIGIPVLGRTQVWERVG